VGSSYIAGATNISYTAKAAGTYKVVVTNSYGCSKTSTGKTVQIVCKSGESSLAGQDYFNVIASPNPTPNLFSIQLQSSSTDGIVIDVINVLGEVVYHATGTYSGIISFGNNLPSGIYIANFSQGNNKKSIMLVKEIQ